MVDDVAWEEKKMRLLIAIIVAAALGACPKKVEPAPVEDAAQVIEDGGAEDVATMDAVVIESGSPLD